MISTSNSLVMHLFGHSSHFVARYALNIYNNSNRLSSCIELEGVYCILSNCTGMILSSLYWKFRNNEGLSL